MDNTLHLTEPWLPTASGAVGLEAALTGADPPTVHPLDEAPLLRLLALMRERMVGDPDYLKTHHDGLHLCGERPFMSLPLAQLEDLRDRPVHAIALNVSSGNEVTLLGRGLDDDFRPWSGPDALLAVITAHAASPSRGRTTRGYGGDAPLARALSFHAHGRTWAETLDLNAPGAVGVAPWEAPIDPRAHLELRETPLNALNASAWPWLALGLVPAGGQVAAVRVAAGMQVDGGEDPHAFYTRVTPKKGGDAVWLPAKNPRNRTAARALVEALLATVEPDAEQHRLPVSFRRAQERGAVRASVSGLSSRAAQPVLFAAVAAELPWPRSAGAADLLRSTLETADALAEAVRKSVAVWSGKAFEVAPALGSEATFWRRAWPALALGLQTGTDTSAHIRGAANRTASDMALSGSGLSEHVTARTRRARLRDFLPGAESA